MEYITLALAFISLLFVGYLFFKSNTKSNNDIKSAIDTTEIKESIKNFNATLSLTVNTVTSQINEVNKRLTEQNDSTNAKINDLNSKIDEKLQKITENVGEGLSKGFKDNGDLMAQLQKELGSITEAQNNIKNLSGDVISLKNVLTNNQSRGRYGEVQLEMLLDNLFNGSKGVLYDTQIKIGVGDDGKELRPDAIVYVEACLDGKIACIDSKFSITGLENLFNTSITLDEATRNSLISDFKSSVKDRIKETSKYIIEGKTIDSPIMFIPNDGIFAFIENELPELVDEAKKQKVVMACPTLLQPLLVSLRMIQIDVVRNKNLAEINNQLRALGVEFNRFKDRWDTINKQLDTATGSVKDFNTTVHKIEKKFEKISSCDNKTLDAVDEIEEIENDK